MTDDGNGLTAFVGRFAPFHNAHARIVRAALDTSSHVAILVGSALQARSTRNPFTYDERVEMIRGSFFADEVARLHFAPIPDSDYNEAAWIGDVRGAVRGIQSSLGIAGTPDLIGHSKDGTSYYLRKFPGWGSISVDSFDEGLSATHLRDYLLVDAGPDSHDATLGQLAGSAPQGTVRVMAGLLGTPAWKDLCESFRSEADYRKPYAHLPYKPWFHTGDPLVVKSGHVLLVRRAGHPFKGLLSLPGGFVEYEEPVEETWIRELYEETGIEEAEDVVRAHEVASRDFSRPHRDPRGRVATRVTHVHLPDGPLPRVHGKDDAAEALWVPLDELRRDEMAFDHHSIIQAMVGGLR